MSWSYVVGAGGVVAYVPWCAGFYPAFVHEADGFGAVAFASCDDGCPVSALVLVFSGVVFGGGHGSIGLL